MQFANPSSVAMAVRQRRSLPGREPPRDPAYRGAGDQQIGRLYFASCERFASAHAATSFATFLAAELQRSSPSFDSLVMALS